MSQVNDMQDHIALEEYLGALDHPAAILLCLADTETEYQHSSNPDLSPTNSAISPASIQGNHHLTTARPQLVRMGSGTGSNNWPLAYGSTTTSSASSADRIPTKIGKSSPSQNRSCIRPPPPTECKLLWGNRYMTADTEELLIEELMRDGLLRRVWSMGGGSSNKIFTLASKQSSERREEKQDSTNCNDDLAEVEAERPKTPPRWLSVPGVSDATRQHNELFESMDWASTPLGPPERWCQSLLTTVNLCLSSPFPVLVSWGPEMVLLYNEPYGRNIGTKHPGILGMRYELAWPEVWEQLAPVVAQAMAGNVIHVDNAQMFLKRENSLEGKCYSLHVGFLKLTVVRKDRDNSNDIGFMIMYLSEPAGDDLDQESQEKESQKTRSMTGSSRSRQHSITGDDAFLQFQLAAHSGFSNVEENDKYIPRNVLSDRSRSLDSYDGDDDSCPFSKYIRMAHCYDEAVVITDADHLGELLPNLSPNAFGDLPVHAVVMPIRSSMEDRTHGIIIIGLSTRLEFNTAYKDWLNTIRGLLATGLASVKLYGEQMARARYLAALNKRKNDELQVMLKKKTDDLRSAELTMSTAFDCCPTGIWIANAEGEIVFLNPAYYQITGLDPNAPLASWIDLVHPDDLELSVRALAECRYKRSKTEFRILKPQVEKDGNPELRWLEGIAGPPYDSSGQLCGTIMDITHRKEKEQYQVRRTEEALERKRQQESFIDMTSHELRNPLSAICLAIEGIVDQLDALAKRTEPSVQEELRSLMKDTEVVSLCTAHMKRLIDDVLSLSKLDSDLLQITAVACSPLAFTRDVVSMFEPELQSKAITHSLKICDGYRQLVSNCVKVDPQRVTQVLINLLANAIKFTSNAPTKQIHCILDASRSVPEGAISNHTNTPSEPLEDEDLFLVWSVTDTGPGLSEEEIGRLFQRFQQAQPKTHVTYGGSGLGLFISRKLTSLLGGKENHVPNPRTCFYDALNPTGSIFLKSKPGEGSTFTFYVRAKLCSCPAEVVVTAGVPSSQLAASRRPNPPTNVAKTKKLKDEPFGSRLRVLLTEDNLINQRLLKRQLIKAGCTVFVANDGVEALEFVREEQSPLDCILMDVEMPRMSGIECARELRRLNIETPIIAVTANARGEQVKEIIACGMDAAVAKPFKTSDLVKRMKDLIASKDALTFDVEDSRPDTPLLSA
ncbi:hypothetical protein QFC21_001748 [Naganishia friedmannii]|uniref:Uncharacterized protein n=1 Tax=Naganishia friedmannii TaxID=89922 RepID=A0ACC2W245_9TREE|nr:hypothetical protein QFC21_001748 [Naganishia friedmannii]